MPKLVPPPAKDKKPMCMASLFPKDAIKNKFENIMENNKVPFSSYTPIPNFKIWWRHFSVDLLPIRHRPTRVWSKISRKSSKTTVNSSSKIRTNQNNYKISDFFSMFGLFQFWQVWFSNISDEMLTRCFRLKKRFENSDKARYAKGTLFRSLFFNLFLE